MTEDSTLYWMLLTIGSIPVAIALTRHATWGVQPTLGGILVSCALCGLAGVLAHRRRLSRERKSH